LLLQIAAAAFLNEDESRNEPFQLPFAQTSSFHGFQHLLPERQQKDTTRQQIPEEMEELVKIRYDAVLETFGFLNACNIKEIRIPTPKINYDLI
jgi:hypothetical protein